MILTRTPLRVSLVGGGTDQPAFCATDTGRVVSFAIEQYVWVAAQWRKPWQKCYNVGYTQIENASTIGQIKHDLIRESLRTVWVDQPVEIRTIASMPGGGSGLGSSSATCVGVLHALHRLRPVHHMSQVEYAAVASTIEIDILGYPIGRQDQYAVALGGMNKLEFDGSSVTAKQIGDDLPDELAQHCLLFWTGIERQSSALLSSQRKDIPRHIHEMQHMAAMARDCHRAILRRDWRAVGELVRAGWETKRGLALGITSPEVEDMMDAALENGAWGAKLCGAGGGGCALVVAPPDRHDAIRDTLGLHEIPCTVDFEGTVAIEI